MDNDDLIKFIENNPPTGEFSPNIWYNIDGGFLEAYWSNEESFVQRANDDFDLYIGFNTGKPTGIKIYHPKKYFTDSKIA